MKSHPKRQLPAFFALWFPLMALGSYPIFSSWQENRYQVYGIDIVPPLLCNALVIGLVAWFFTRLYKKDRMAGYVGGVLSTLLVSGNFERRLNDIYPFLQAINPTASFLPDDERIIIGIAFFVGILYFSRFIGLLLSRLFVKKGWETRDFLASITVLITVTFLLEFFPTAFAIATEWKQFTYIPPALPTSSSLSAAKSKPDIYYIVPDRYTSQTVLSQQFNFDNSAFVNFLTSNGFSINPDAHQNYPYTTMSISSTLDANYHTDIIEKFGKEDDQTLTPYHQSVRNGAVIQQLKALGYTYDELGNWYETSNESPLADNEYQPDEHLTLFGHTFTVNTFVRNQFEQSPFWDIMNKGIQLGNFQFLMYHQMSEIDANAYKLNLLTQLAQQNTGGRFIFAHLLVPHDPYYFNADGSINPDNGDDNTGEPVKTKYVNQVQYINTQLENLVTTINKTSKGQAVIIIQSDEGPYPAVFNEQNFNGEAVGDELSNTSMLDWSDQDLKMKFGILAAYHIPQASVTDLAQGGNSVDIFRVVLNSYFNDSLPYLPNCFYAYPNGRSQSFLYANINQRLTGQANAACPANSDFGKS